jgi:hypothetical protein
MKGQLGICTRPGYRPSPDVCVYLIDGLAGGRVWLLVGNGVLGRYLP